MFKLWLLSANELQLGWAELIFFSSVFQYAGWSFTEPGPFILKRARCVKGVSECIPCVRLQAGGLGCVYRTASCDKLRIMRLAFIWTHQNQTQMSKVSHTSHDSKQSSLLPHSPSHFLPSFLSLLLSSTFNVRHFDTEHPISRVLVDWLYMQMGW